MLPLKKILCPTDFSEPAFEGFKIAGELAAQFSAEMLLVHVISPLPVVHGGPAPTGFQIPAILEELQRSAEKSLVKMQREKLPADIQARTFVMHGRPAHEIVELATREKVDIIVIATHGESGWQRFVFGSVAEKVVRHADCPVLTVRAPNQETKGR